MLAKAQESGQVLDEEELAFLADPGITDYQGEGHMERKCTQPKRPRNDVWFKEKLVLAKAHESGQVLDEEQLAFLADPGIIDCHDVQPIIIYNAAFQTNDLDPYDSDCDDISSAKAVLMVNLLSYGSDVLSKLERYKERVKTLEQRFNVDLNSREKLIDSQMDDEIRNRCALKQEIDSLKQTLSNQVKENESLLQTSNVFKRESKEKKKEVSLDNDRLLDHIICQDVINIVMHVDYVLAKVLPTDNKCLIDEKSLTTTATLVNDNLEIKILEQENDYLFELILSQDIVHICVNSLASWNDCREMQQGFIDEYNENLMLKAELAKKGQMVV
ncbi:hypothetical protein Tco_1005759 [Tanacetum coccineum]|uniref:Uncharacterized protein n=1 Tax=Tanacetum coccineum TaxID=301880 RepID=A0ABQ5FFM4_9ASTR